MAVSAGAGPGGKGDQGTAVLDLAQDLVTTGSTGATPRQTKQEVILQAYCFWVALLAD